MAIAVAIAEFPNYQLCQSFCVFNLARTTSSNRDGVQDCERIRSFERLAKAFQVPVEALIDEHAAYFPAAQRICTSSGCSYSEAWQQALETPAKSISRSKHPAPTLLRVALRYFVYRQRRNSSFTNGMTCCVPWRSEAKHLFQIFERVGMPLPRPSASSHFPKPNAALGSRHWVEGRIQSPANWI